MTHTKLSGHTICFPHALKQPFCVEVKLREAQTYHQQRTNAEREQHAMRRLRRESFRAFDGWREQWELKRDARRRAEEKHAVRSRLNLRDWLWLWAECAGEFKFTRSWGARLAAHHEVRSNHYMRNCAH